jgi:hypothetical protein
MEESKLLFKRIIFIFEGYFGDYNKLGYLSILGLGEEVFFFEK